jgi:hypothetical protein
MTSVFSPIESSISDRGASRLLAARPRHQLAAAVWADEVHLLSTARAICAFVAADVSHSARSKRGSAFFADSFEL